MDGGNVVILHPLRSKLKLFFDSIKICSDGCVTGVSSGQDCASSSVAIFATTSLAFARRSSGLPVGPRAWRAPFAFFGLMTPARHRAARSAGCYLFAGSPPSRINAELAPCKPS